MNAPFALNTQQVPGGPSLLRPAGLGSVFYVDSNGGGSATSGGLSPQSAFTTLDAAINACTANKGDTIFVMPGHAETVAAAAGFAADVAGIRIIGLGQGDSRPVFTFTATDSTVTLAAAGILIENLRFNAGISAVVVGLAISGAADGSTIRNCQFYWGGTTGYDFIDMAIVAAGANRLTFDNNEFIAEPAVAGSATAIKLSGASSNVTVKNSRFMGDFSTACLSGITTLSQHLLFIDNLVHNTSAGDPYISVLTGTTGIIARNMGQAGGATIAANAVADAMSHCENYVTNTTGTIAIVKGAGGSPSLDAD